MGTQELSSSVMAGGSQSRANTMAGNGMRNASDLIPFSDLSGTPKDERGYSIPDLISGTSFLISVPFTVPEAVLVSSPGI
jgi:hypothetical protein